MREDKECRRLLGRGKPEWKKNYFGKKPQKPRYKNIMKRHKYDLYCRTVHVVTLVM